ncbi:MAG: ABC transporter permease [Parachlamydia sp.]|jgi:oligopeptide transport system permease protein|nr:ABC transporter permease [Parachlamydia sp.]
MLSLPRLFYYGLFLFCLVVLLALLGPFFSGYASNAVQLDATNLPPEWSHWFGTDDLGRDILARVSEGTGISLAMGLSAALIDLAIGLLWGGTAGFCKGRTDEVLMRLADILYAIPTLLVVILIVVSLGPHLISILLALTIVGWITMARIVRGQVLQIMSRDYVTAARLMGAGFGRILLRHVVPNAAGPILATLTLTIPSAIYTEAFLSFLGLGLQAPLASLGTMAYEGLPAFQYYPWRLFFPSFAIIMALLSFHLMAEGIRRAVSR